MRGNCGKNNVFRQLVIKRQHYFKILQIYNLLHYKILNYVHGDQMPGHWYYQTLLKATKKTQKKFAMYFGLDAMELDIEKKVAI